MSNDQNIEEAIVEFVEYFNRQLEIIKGADLGESTRNYQQIQYFSILDTLSKSIDDSKNNRKRENNRKRFVRFLTNCSNWEDVDRVSIVNLNIFLKKLGCNVFDPVLEFLDSQIRDYNHRVVDIHEDPLISEFDEYDLDNLIRRVSKKNLDYFQHKHLFYKHRNSLVHELGAKKIGMSPDQSSESPHYFPWNIESEGIKGWDLVYPLGFYELLCKNAVENVKRYFLSEMKNPFSLFETELIEYE